MTDMPERIWAFDFWEGNIPRAGDWTDEWSEAPEGAAEYIRADVVEAHLSDPSAVRANMLRGTIAKPTVEQIVHLYGREAFQPMIDAAIARALEKACLAVSEHADWPEDEHGRTEQGELFARVINAILSITPAAALAVPEVAALVDTAARVLAPLDEPCRHDHHGYCQAHFVEADCSVAALRAALAAIAEVQG